ncbi:Anoctamin-like protein [Glycine max]|nr:Anoctamin-like protein [Glycine max]
MFQKKATTCGGRKSCHTVDALPYYGAKIAIYFAFLGMFTQRMLFPAAFGLTLQLIDLVVLPIFFIMVILWAIMFSQFWKRKNSALLASAITSLFAEILPSSFTSFFFLVFCCCRWPISSIVAADQGYKISGRKSSSWQPPMELMKVFETDRAKEKEIF